MALFVKQDFTPPLLSRKWIATKCRPNMLLQCRLHVIAILESGLMFREDSARVEQESPAADELWAAAGGGATGWLTRGERALSVMAVGAALVIFPPRIHAFHRGTLVRITAYAALPLSIRIWHRLLARGSALKTLLDYMRDYLALARRTMACVKEYKLLHKGLDSVAAMLESTTTLLWRQQTALSLLMARSSSALLGNFPWLYEDVDWEALLKISEERFTPTDGDLVKIHHAFLVIQSTLLKHIAMAHFVQPPHVQKRYLNHNERVYWLHNDLLKHMKEEFKENFESLERMYRLLRNYGTNDSTTIKRTGVKVNDSWYYSEVHSNIARSSIELKVALNKCINLDVFLDTCATNKQELDLQVLNKDLDDLIDDVTKCLSTVQSAQIRLKKLQSKVHSEKGKDVDGNVENETGYVEDDARDVVQIGDVTFEPKDEVFYLLKTEEDDQKTEAAGDLTTGPGTKEKDTTKVVLKELRRKLVKREDIMRERERKALSETMPELKGHLPEFPRQITEDEHKSKGYISKIVAAKPKKLFGDHKIEHRRSNDHHHLWNKHIRYQQRSYNNINEVANNFYEIVSKSKLSPNIIMSVELSSNVMTVTKWVKSETNNKSQRVYSSGESDGPSDVETSAMNKAVTKVMNDNKTNGTNDARNYRCTKKELEVYTASSESDYEDFGRKEKRSPLIDLRRHRIAGWKKHQTKREVVADQDESAKPVEYRFGTGMAMASVLQVSSNAKPTIGHEEVFVGNGEVSEDSGNDEDA